MSDRIHAHYWLETWDDPQRAAEVIAGEQSSGTFRALANETPALKARAGAQVERLQLLDTVDQPCLPGRYPAGSRFTRCLMELSWPLANLGPSLPKLMATIAGKLFELRQVSGLRLLDLKLPPAFAAAHPGPAFGIAGTRRLAGVASGPLIGRIIKPSVGLGAEQTAAELRQLIAGGIDFIKDDELQSDGPACPFDDRVRAVMREVLAGGAAAGPQGGGRRRAAGRRRARSPSCATRCRFGEGLFAMTAPAPLGRRQRGRGGRCAGHRRAASAGRSGAGCAAVPRGLGQPGTGRPGTGAQGRPDGRAVVLRPGAVGPALSAARARRSCGTLDR